MNQKTEKSLIPESSPLNFPIEDFLSKDDFINFQKLKKTLSSQVCRNRRYKRIQSFNEILLAIRGFIERRNEDSWKRSLVCGVCWYQNYICISIKQMSYLIEKCKSSINGSLQRLSLIVLPNRKQTFDIITGAIPFLKDHREILKTWSVRQYLPPSTIPAIFINQIRPTKSLVYTINVPHLQ